MAGDVGELFADIEWSLRTLAERFATVIWTPGSHELWTRFIGRRHPRDGLIATAIAVPKCEEVFAVGMRRFRL